MQEQITNPYMAMSDEFLWYQLDQNRGCNPPECKRIMDEIHRRQRIERMKNNDKK